MLCKRVSLHSRSGGRCLFNTFSREDQFTFPKLSGSLSFMLVSRPDSAHLRCFLYSTGPTLHTRDVETSLGGFNFTVSLRVVLEVYCVWSRVRAFVSFKSIGRCLALVKMGNKNNHFHNLTAYRIF